MLAFGRAILITLIAGVSLLIFLNLAFFFPWYLTMVEAGFAVSQMIATENYLTKDHYDDIKTRLQSCPIFSVLPDDVEIEAKHYNGKPAIEYTYNSLENYYAIADSDACKDEFTGKPYVQMGNPVRVTIYASYPFQMTLFGNPITLTPIDLTFSMTTTTTKHYKDLDYDFIGSPTIGWEDDIYYDDWENLVDD